MQNVCLAIDTKTAAEFGAGDDTSSISTRVICTLLRTIFAKKYLDKAISLRYVVAIPSTRAT
jgi:hypothetical protein